MSQRRLGPVAGLLRHRSIMLASSDANNVFSTLIIFDSSSRTTTTLMNVKRHNTVLAILGCSFGKVFITFGASTGDGLHEFSELEMYPPENINNFC